MSMTREIKFRAWHNTLKVMLNVYVISQQTDNNGYIPDCRGWYGENKQVYFSFNQVEWMQFTGLEDKNGNEICEWDGLTFHLKGVGSGPAECYKDSGCFWLRVAGQEKPFPLYEYARRKDIELTIIGNRYESTPVPNPLRDYNF